MELLTGQQTTNGYGGSSHSDYFVFSPPLCHTGFLMIEISYTAL